MKAKNLNLRVDIATLKRMEEIRKKESLNWSNLIRQFINEEIKKRN